MTVLMARELGINKTENYRISDWSDWVEAIEPRAHLFRTMQREYGGCVSMIYRDADDTPHGWVFEKRVRYEDARPDIDTGAYKESDYYVRQVWVEMADKSELCVSCHQLAVDHHHFAEYSKSA